MRFKGKYIGIRDANGKKIRCGNTIIDVRTHNVGRVKFGNGVFYWKHGVNWGEIDGQDVLVIN